MGRREWAKPLACSKGEINRAGAALIASSASAERDRAADLVNAWRSSFSFPLNTFQNNLRHWVRPVDQGALVAQRLKRFSSIQAKLRRQPRMELTQMQDIGGVRAIVKDLPAVTNLADRLVGQGFKIRDDYITTPKDDGYRGIHIIGRYEGSRFDQEAWNGYRIEIQLRSKRQHYFSTAVETVTTFTGYPLKFGGGPPEWREFFSLMGSVIALGERAPLVPGTPDNEATLIDEVKDLALRLHVRELLEAWTVASTRMAVKAAGSRTISYLLILDVARRTVQAVPFPSAEAASTQLLLFEKAIMNEKSPSLDVVQVAAKSVQELKRAYPNYYSDTRAFLRIMREATGV